jgi:hypothetical protein
MEERKGPVLRGGPLSLVTKLLILVWMAGGLNGVSDPLWLTLAIML